MKCSIFGFKLPHKALYVHLLSIKWCVRNQEEYSRECLVPAIFGTMNARHTGRPVTASEIWWSAAWDTESKAFSWSLGLQHLFEPHLMGWGDNAAKASPLGITATFKQQSLGWEWGVLMVPCFCELGETLRWPSTHTWSHLVCISWPIWFAFWSQALIATWRPPVW